MTFQVYEKFRKALEDKMEAREAEPASVSKHSDEFAIDWPNMTVPNIIVFENGFTAIWDEQLNGWFDPYTGEQYEITISRVDETTDNKV